MNRQKLEELKAELEKTFPTFTWQMPKRHNGLAFARGETTLRGPWMTVWAGLGRYYVNVYHAKGGHRECAEITVENLADARAAILAKLEERTKQNEVIKTVI